MISNGVPLIGSDTYLVTSFGKSFTANGFGNKMREWCDKAELPECASHGLRKLCLKRDLQMLVARRSRLPPSPVTWWARQDSNLQPDRYERPALTIELQAPPVARDGADTPYNDAFSGAIASFRR